MISPTRLAAAALFALATISCTTMSVSAQEGQSLANQTANPLGGDFMLVINQYDAFL